MAKFKKRSKPAEELPAIVGQSLPFDCNHPALQCVDPQTLCLWYLHTMAVKNYPDRDKIRVDVNGYVTDFCTVQPDYSVRPLHAYVNVPAAVLHALLDCHRSELPEHVQMLSPQLLQLVARLERKNSRGRDCYIKISFRLLKELLELGYAPGGEPAEKKGSGHSPLPSPALMDQVVAEMLSKAGAAEVGYDDQLVLGIQNCDFLNASKASFYLDAWARIFRTAHLIIMVEVDPPGLAVVAREIGYGHFCCKPNSRGQAVGFLVHPRLRLTGKPETIWAVANVKRNLDLRPGFLLPLQDTASNFNFDIEGKHLKSMRGGEIWTSAIRVRQSIENAKVVVNRMKRTLIIGGDLNCPLDRTHDLDPLIAAGCVLVEAADTTPTQDLGSRVDGFLTSQLQKEIAGFPVINWWMDSRIKRALTDHGYKRVLIKGTARFATGSGAW